MISRACGGPVCCLLIFVFKISKISFRNTIRVSNSLDPDQASHFVKSDLGLNCLQRSSAEDTSKQRVKNIILQTWQSFCKASVDISSTCPVRCFCPLLLRSSMMIVFPLVYTNKPVISNVKIIVKDAAHLSDFFQI